MKQGRLPFGDAARIARYDYLIALREGRFWAAAVLVTVLLVFCLVSTQHAYRLQKAQQIAASEETHQQFLDQGDKNPHSAAHYGMYAFKPLTLLSLIDPGVQPYTGVAVFMEPHHQNTAIFRPADDESSSARFGSLSISTLVLVFIPFIIIALLYDSIAADYSNGTLKQLLASGITKESFGLGKLLGSIAKLASVLLPAGLLLAVLLGLADTQGMQASAARLALLASVYGVYCLLWLLLCLSVSAILKEPSRVVGALIFAWLVMTLALPPVAVDVVREIYHTPSRLEFEKAVANDLKTPPDYEDQLKRSVMAEYHVSRIENLPVNWAGVRLAKNEEHTTRVYREHMRALEGRFEGQNQAASFIGIVDPALVARQASAAIAGTDLREFYNFGASADRFRELFVQAMNQDQMEHGMETGHLATKTTFASVPKFAYTSLPMGDVLHSQILTLGILLAQFVAAIVLFTYAIRRLRAL